MLLFIVDNTFLIPGRGLILTPGPGKKPANLGDKIKLIRPDKSVIETIIIGMSFNDNRDILVEKELNVPIGTEVWLNE